MQQRTPAHSFAIVFSCLPGARSSCSSSSSRATTRCRSSPGSSMTSTRRCRSCRRPRTTSPRRSTRARGARARAHHGRHGGGRWYRKWSLSVVVLHQCASECLTSEYIVSRLTFNHELHDKTRSRAHRHLSSLIQRSSGSPSMATTTQVTIAHSRRDDESIVRASACATAADHPRSPAAAPPAQRISEHQGPDKQLPASTGAAQM